MPLFWLSLAFIAGLALGAGLAWPWPAWAAAGAGLLLAVVFERRLLRGWRLFSAWRGSPWGVQSAARLPLGVLLAALALGAARSAASQPVIDESSLAWYNGQGSIRLVGVVQQPPERGGSSMTLRLAAEQIVLLEQEAASRPVSGAVRVTLPLGSGWRYGDRLELEGKLSAPETIGLPSYAAYLKRGGIFSLLSYPVTRRLERDAGSLFWASVYDLQALAQRTIAALLPQPESGLLAGILLGDDSRLPDGVLQAFRDSGVTHIIAVSGFNIAVLSGLFVQVLGRMLKARLAVPLAMLAISGYTLLTGASPSVVRAAIMGGVGLVGPLLGRHQVGANSLAFTAAVMAFFNPTLLWDASFQLSFAATLGLVVYAEPLQQGFVGLLQKRIAADLARRVAGPVGEYLLFTLAAQFFTLPITAVIFQRGSLSAVLANPLILPVQPLAMILGGISTLVGMAFLPVGQALAWLCWPLLAYTVRVAEWMAQIPFGVWVVGQVGTGLVALYYAAALVPATPWLRARLAAAWKPATALVGTGLLAAGLWQAAAAAPDGRLHLDLINLAGEQVALLRTPGGQTWLVGGAPDADGLAGELGRRLPLFSNRLDGLVILGSSAASMESLADLANHYPPGILAANPQANLAVSARNSLKRIRKASGQDAALEVGTRFDLGKGAVLQVQTVGAQGAVLAIEWGRFRAVLVGDAAFETLDSTRREVLAGASLAALGGGLSAEDAQAWAYTLQPRLLVVAGQSPGQAGAIDLREFGALSVTSDGERMWVENFAR